MKILKYGGLILSGVFVFLSESYGNGIYENKEILYDGRDISFLDVLLQIYHFINVFFSLAGSIAIIFIIYGGYQFMVGSISETGKENGKKIIRSAIFGLIITFSSWVLVHFVLSEVMGTKVELKELIEEIKEKTTENFEKKKLERAEQLQN